MNIIKFRLRDKDNNIIGYEIWKDNQWKYEILGAKVWFETFKFLNCVVSKELFSGFLDSNGVEIYENDKVKFLDNYGYIVCRNKDFIEGVVKFIDGAFWCHDEENDGDRTRLVRHMVEYDFMEGSPNLVTIIK